VLRSQLSPNRSVPLAATLLLLFSAVVRQSSAQLPNERQQPGPAARAPQELQGNGPLTINPQVEAQISVHYLLGSMQARAEAEYLAVWLASSGYGVPQIVSTGHVLRSPVVRYFYQQDADAANGLVRALQKLDASLRIEDCERFRHKPSTGAIEVWLAPPGVPDHG
jgi:hypothetical protein